MVAIYAASIGFLLELLAGGFDGVPLGGALDAIARDRALTGAGICLSSVYAGQDPQRGS